MDRRRTRLATRYARRLDKKISKYNYKIAKYGVKITLNITKTKFSIKIVKI